MVPITHKQYLTSMWCTKTTLNWLAIRNITKNFIYHTPIFNRWKRGTLQLSLLSLVSGGGPSPCAFSHLLLQRSAVQLPKPKTKKVATKPSSASLELRRGTGSSMFCFFVETRLHRRKLKAAATVDGSSAKPRASIDINSILVREHAYLTTVSRKRMSWITAWSICQRLSLWPTREQNRPIRKRVSCM